MCKITLAGSAMALALACAGSAGAQPYLPDWGVADMKTAITASGSTVVREDIVDEGAPYVAAKTPGGLKFTVTGRVCDYPAGAKSGPKRCRGGFVQTRFTLASDAAVDAAVKKWAPEYAAVSVSNGGNGDLLVSRYLIFDHGLHRDNLKLNISVFTGIAEDIWAAN
ncbi:MAG: hypothetical protein V4466_07665 [Pseudomonadota bacterium]